MTATLPTRETAATAVTFPAIGTTNAILVTDPRTLPEATRYAKAHLAELARAASRFRPDSEVSLLAARSADAPDATVTAQISPLFVDYLRAARHAARISGGLVDFTVGSAVVASGYDTDMDLVRARCTPYDSSAARGGRAAAAPDVPGWQRVLLDRRRLTVPRGTLIDLGATAKAHAADTIARRLAERLPGGYLVNLGGDIATAGDLPEGGWLVGVGGRSAAAGAAADDTAAQVVALRHQGLTTSSTRLRRWATTTGEAHHIVDPRTGRPAPITWALVSCVGATALEANTASTASIVLGTDAPEWLRRHDIPARLEALDGTVATTPGWPDA